jgi:hypothetical protein
LCALIVVAGGFVGFWQKSASIEWQKNATGDGIVIPFRRLCLPTGKWRL